MLTRYNNVSELTTWFYAREISKSTAKDRDELDHARKLLPSVAETHATFEPEGEFKRILAAYLSSRTDLRLVNCSWSNMLCRRRNRRCITWDPTNHHDSHESRGYLNVDEHGTLWHCTWLIVKPTRCVTYWRVAKFSFDGHIRERLPQCSICSFLYLRPFNDDKQIYAPKETP